MLLGRSPYLNIFVFWNLCFLRYDNIRISALLFFVDPWPGHVDVDVTEISREWFMFLFPFYYMIEYVNAIWLSKNNSSYALYCFTEIFWQILKGAAGIQFMLQVALFPRYTVFYILSHKTCYISVRSFGWWWSTKKTYISLYLARHVYWATWLTFRVSIWRQTISNNQRWRTNALFSNRFFVSQYLFGSSHWNMLHESF